MTCTGCHRQAPAQAPCPDCAAPLADAARAYLGVPFRHQGRNPAVGIDCIGLLVLACRDAGMPVDDFDRVNYARDPHDGLLEQHLQVAFGAPVSGLQPGDIVAMAYGRPVRHLGIVGQRDGALSLIHTSDAASVKRVVEHGIDAKWRRRIKRVYRVPA